MPRGFERFIPWSSSWPNFEDDFYTVPVFTDYDLAFLAYCGISAN